MAGSAPEAQAVATSRSPNHREREDATLAKLERLQQRDPSAIAAAPREMAGNDHDLDT
jgi:hypothetical protein